jgi:hypothetical protein
MKIRVILSAIPMLAVLGCGSDNGKFTLSTGTYKLSSTSAVAPDNCNLTSVFPDGTTIQITVSGTSATFAFGSDPSHNPVTTIDGNTINSGSKTFDVDDNASTIPQAQRVDCVETITETTSGDLVANDQDQGALVYSSVAKSGTQCTAQYLTNYKAYPCSSTLSYMAKKQ